MADNTNTNNTSSHTPSSSIDADATATAATTQFVDHFGAAGAQYRSFRPSYPIELYDIIKEYTKEQPKKLAFDVACGNGQATVQIAEFFDKVIGFEPSDGQFKNCIQAPNVEYRVSPAEDIDWKENESVDLITVATAVHWFNLPVFYKECQRLLKSNGSLIIWTYGFFKILGNENAEEINKTMGTKTLAEYWAPANKIVAEKYVNIHPPFSQVERKEITFKVDVTLDQVVGHYQTWSAYSKYLKTNECILPKIREQLLQAFNTSDSSIPVVLEYTVSMILFIVLEYTNITQ
ncbi:hypothetical protein DFA_05387 [Cavenderia fasciculata]|uniref:Methyltransferase type 11 domain-containing protein n=1 Tax=Cavenderia fasciculata TaxID=261658 RepID=F4PL33_CACFS|nr:uncharacterized protein DFA_05387 [Cavenderia fasciculata]EGG23255.1 hypothetical protein DFA_05387 [Cavenderia fasciculata]|eukprot:XP_004361106.1 hypothetical protein DFA_05387 [Cavenderia fasciculata]